jgi:hypothetical protein
VLSYLVSRSSECSHISRDAVEVVAAAAVVVEVVEEAVAVS